MDLDPVREGQGVRFQAVISNLSRHLGRVSLFVKDKDEVVAAVEDVSLRPGIIELSSLRPVTGSSDRILASR